MAKTDLTAARVRALFDYDADTGMLLWSATGKGRRFDRAAGTKGLTGYIFIVVDRCRWRAHRLAWMHHYGDLPNGQIDHINGIRDDNRIANLRDVTNSVNGQNKKRATARNKSGFLGVSWKKGLNRWIATIHHNGRQVHLGSFDQAEEASRAYLCAKRRLHAGCSI